MAKKGKSANDAIRRKMLASLQAGTNLLAKLYREDISTPVSIAGEGEVDRSEPGEYPRLETGVGYQHVSTNINKSLLIGEAGIEGPGREGGMYLHWLKHNEPPTSRGPRKAMDDTFLENEAQIKQAMKRAARNA